MDRQFDPRKPQGSSWTSITPSTPIFSPTKFTPASQQTTWKPSFAATNRSDSQEIIIGNVQQDSSGGFVHTFGAAKTPAASQTASSNSPQNAPWRNSPVRQDSVNSVTPRYVQEIVVPTGLARQQIRSPVRQQSYQSNASQFSPVQQVSSPVYFQPQNNGYENRPNGSSVAVYPSVRQPGAPYLSRQESIPHQIVRQDSKPFQRQDSRPFQRQDSKPFQRQDSIPYQTQSYDSSAYPNSWNTSTDVVSPYQPSRQDSWNQQTPSAQDSWSNQPSQQTVFQPARQNSYTNSSVNATSPSYPASRQDSFQQQSPSYPTSTHDFFNQQAPSWSNQPAREDSWSNSPVNASSPSQPTSLWSNQPTRPESVPYQPPNSNAAPGLFTVHSPKDSTNSPISYAAAGPFTRQKSTSGPKPWSPGPVEAFPTPPPFSPSTEAAGVPWPAPNLPSPPPPPPPISTPIVNSSPVVAPPPPPPPPPPPMPSSIGMNQEVPPWKKQIQATKEAKAAAGIPQTPGTPGAGQELPAALANSMKKDKKPFTYLPGGLDLSEIRSPKMQRRLMAHQQQAPPPPSTMGQQVLLQPRQNTANAPSQVQNQMESLNLGEGEHMAAAVNAGQTQNDPTHPGQSRSFRILQMMTGGDDETDSVPSHAVRRTEPEEEVRFTGLRRPDNPIPSRAFHALQKMTQGAEQNAPQNPIDSRFGNENAEELQQDDTPVDIRYKGGYIPGRSFKMLQEMTGMNEDGESTGIVVPSVLEAKRHQRKANLHLNINQPQSPQSPKQFPQPSIPASQQKGEEAPTMYQGSRIPSKSFRMLQAMTGESGEDGTDM